MADIIDQAQELTQFACENQINRARAAAKNCGHGYCLNCGVSLAPTHSYCDADCRDDHSKRERMRGIKITGYDQ